MVDLKAFEARYLRNELLPTDIPALFSEVQRLRAEVERWERYAAARKKLQALREELDMEWRSRG